MMDANKILQQMTLMFSIFMVMFYIGVGAYLVFFFDQSYIEKATRTIIGSAFMLYGTFRAFRTFVQLKQIFSSNKETEDE